MRKILLIGLLLVLILVGVIVVQQKSAEIGREAPAAVTEDVITDEAADPESEAEVINDEVESPVVNKPDTETPCF